MPLKQRLGPGRRPADCDRGWKTGWHGSVYPSPPAPPGKEAQTLWGEGICAPCSAGLSHCLHPWFSPWGGASHPPPPPSSSIKTSELSFSFFFLNHFHFKLSFSICLQCYEMEAQAERKTGRTQIEPGCQRSVAWQIRALTLYSWFYFLS